MPDKITKFWQVLAKNKLSKSESKDVYMRVLEAIEKKSVREGDVACQKGCMDPRQLLREDARSVRLSSAEDAEIGERIRAYVREHPLSDDVRLQPIVPATYAELFWRNPFRILRPVPLVASLLFIVAFGSSVLFASESAIPGDALYFVKVHMVEPTNATLHFSVSSRTQYELERLTRRLEEATKLAASGTLDARTKKQISAEVQAQLERISAMTQRLVLENNEAEALYTHSRVETTLLAHAAVLGSILEASKEQSQDVKDLLTDVHVVERQAKSIRTNFETQVTQEAQQSGGGRAGAERSMQLATNRIEEATASLAEMESLVENHILVQARGRLDYARRMFAHARSEIDAGNYESAMRIAGDSQRAAQEAKSMLRLAAAARTGGR